MAAFAALIAAGPMLFAGCAGRPSFLTGGPTTGQLKTSVAHLEYENAQMKRDMAKLRRENRQFEERVVQQEQDNGELTARLDDARNLLRDRGVDPGERATARHDGAGDSSDGSDGFRTLPAGQSNRKRRKPPVARIPGQFSPATPESERDDEAGTLGPPQGTTGWGTGGDHVGLRLDDEPERTVGYRGQMKWAPIAGATSDPASRVR
jgi:hypothetical protein